MKYLKFTFALIIPIWISIYIIAIPDYFNKKVSISGYSKNSSFNLLKLDSTLNVFLFDKGYVGSKIDYVYTNQLAFSRGLMPEITIDMSLNDSMNISLIQLHNITCSVDSLVKAKLDNKRYYNIHFSISYNGREFKYVPRTY